MVNISRICLKWKKQDAEFSKLMDEALGRRRKTLSILNMGEAQLLNLIKEKKLACPGLLVKTQESKVS